MVDWRARFSKDNVKLLINKVKNLLYDINFKVGIILAIVGIGTLVMIYALKSKTKKEQK